MDEDAYDMAAAYANAGELMTVKKYHGKDGKVNMCKAIQEMLEDERQEGIQTGIQTGLQALIETCQEVGLAQEELKEKVTQKFKVSAEKAQEYVEKYWK